MARDDTEPVVNLAHAGPAPGGGFDLTLQAGNDSAQQVLLHFADAMRTWFTEHGGKNYVEARLHDSHGRQFVMSVAPAGKRTAHELRLDVEEELDKALATIARLEALTEELAKAAVPIDDNHSGRDVIDQIVQDLRVALQGDLASTTPH